MRLDPFAVLTAALLACNPEDPTDEPLDDTDAEVPLATALGQLMIVGFRGIKVDDSSPITQQIAAGQIGGIILFDYDIQSERYGRNITSAEQLTTLNAKLKSYATVPLITSVDQEGGAVARLNARTGFPATESAESLGDRNDAAYTEAAGAAMALTMSQTGFNVDYAPVVDVNVNPDSPAIGRLGRSFSADPEVVISQAEAMINGFDAHGILSTLKHFPGHGSATTNSHAGLTDVTDTWTEMELEPYEQLIHDGMADIIMTAHVRNDHLDPDWPATLSPIILKDLLRGELGYDGVVISDDMQMGAIQDQYRFEDAVVAAMLAGNDLLAFANNNPKTYDEEIGIRAAEVLTAAVEDGRIPRARIDEAYRRVMALKARLAP